MAQISKVFLLNVPLENDYKNTLYFANASAQQTYFRSKVVRSFEDFSYQRKDERIRIPVQFDNLLNCNYVMYQNPAYSNKWFYAFITDIKYVNDGNTDIFIETDVMQTWAFDYVLKSSFIEREHVSDDTVGAHTIQEDLGTGEYVVAPDSVTEFDYGEAFSVCFQVSELIGGIPAWTTTRGRYYNGIFTGLWFFACSIANAEHVIKGYNQAGKDDAILSAFMVPTLMLATFSMDDCTLDGQTFKVYTPPITAGSYPLASKTISRPSTIDGYAPRNNKLFTYPYCFLYADNNVGQTTVYRWEDFGNPAQAHFTEEGAIGQGCAIKLIPQNYKRLGTSGETRDTGAYAFALTAGKLPICAWATDYYTAYVIQNGLNMAMDIGSGLIGTAASVATGGAGAAIGGIMGLGAITRSLGDLYQASIAPDQARGNANNSDINFAVKRAGITVFNQNIRAERAAIIDGYFDMFGYQVNAVKVPNKAHRQRWWYTKTIDVNIDGPIPMKDMQKIKNSFNNGITFWRNPSEIQDYSLPNGIV